MAEPTSNDYEPETAGRHMVPVVTARENDRVTDVLAELVSRGPEHHDTVHVVDERGELHGVARLLALVAADGDTQIGTLARAAPSVHRDTDQETVARLALRNSLSEVPVTDHEGRLVGAVPALALLAILRDEHHEDMDRLAGIRRQQAQAVGALADSPIQRLRRRMPWLIVGLAGSIAGALAATRFEALIGRHIALAFFLPTVIYLADAISTQTEAIVIRGLSVAAAKGSRIVSGELVTGTLIGGLLAMLAFPVVFIMAGYAVALTVSVSLIAAAAIATTISLLLAWGLQRAGADPAYGAGPLGTVIQDVVSLLIYLGVALAIIRG